jgi:uncharacterized protein DUF3168
MSATIELQTAIRARLVATLAVTALVPAANILDRHARPAPDPSIVLGEDQAIEDDDVERIRQRIFSTLHVWKKEASLAGAKAIAGEIRTALHGSRLVLASGYFCGDTRVSDMRFLRDPDGETSHAIVTVESRVGIL